MKVFGRYFTYRLKQSAPRTAVLSVLSLVFCLDVVSSSISNRNVLYKETGIYMLAIILGLFCTLIPMLELSGFKNRRNLDTLYFFPIKREKMALAHYLSGALQIFTIYTVSFLATWILLLARTNCFNLSYMPLYYLFSLLLGFVMYSVFMFIFGEANTVADGVLFCALWVLVLNIVMFVARAYILKPFIIDDNRELWIKTSDLPTWGIIYTPINNLTVIFQDLIEVNRKPLEYDYTARSAERYISEMYMFFIWGAIGIAAAVGYLISFKKKGAQMAGEISESYFGYKLLIPLYGYSLLLMYSQDVDIMTIIIFALMLIGYFIYRRGIKLKRSDIIFIACGIIPIVLGNMIEN